MPQDAQGLVYAKYQVLIGEQWKTIDTTLPFTAQIRGMRGYRLWNFRGEIIKQELR